MTFKKCPRCEENGYEFLKTHSCCHNCNFNSVEGFSWQQPVQTDVPFKKPEFDKSIDIATVMKALGSKQSFTQTDYTIIRKAIESLSPTLQQVVYLKFWKRYDSMRIGSFLNMRARSVEARLLEAFHILKQSCLSDPTFSRNQLQSMTVQPPQLTAAAA